MEEKGVVYDPTDSRLKHGEDTEPVGQQEVYLVLTPEERAKGFVRPYRPSYRHQTCGQVTSMSRPIAETFARDPAFYGGTYCATCAMHRPLSEFVWLDGSPMGS